MTNARPILFSPAMARALLDGKKTQTRRLATTPLATLKKGQCLYVREAFRAARYVDHIAPINLSNAIPIHFEADHYLKSFRNTLGKVRPAIHMPRRLSRITLQITEKRFQRLNDISDKDALAEGLRPISKDGEIYKYGVADSDGFPGTDDFGWPWYEWTTEPRDAFIRLWNGLHGNTPGETWEDNPEIVALTFKVYDSKVRDLAA